MPTESADSGHLDVIRPTRKSEPTRARSRLGRSAGSRRAAAGPVLLEARFRPITSGGQRTLPEGDKLYAADQRQAAWPMWFGSQPTPPAKIVRQLQLEAQLVHKGVQVLRCVFFLIPRPGAKSLA